MSVRRFATRLVCLVVAVSLSACANGVRTEYVYVDSDGSHHRVDDGRRLVIDIRDVRPADDAGQLFTGTWTARGPWPTTPEQARRSLVQLQFTTRTADSTVRRGYGLHGEDAAAFVRADPAAADVQLRVVLQREQGRLVFEGADAADAADRASGTVRIEPDARYVSEMRRLTGGPLPPGRFVEAMLADLTVEYAAAVRSAIPDATFDDVLMLRQAGVGAAYVTELDAAGYGFSAREVVTLRNSGVSADYAADLREAGYRLPAGEIVKLRNSGVGAQYAAELKGAGYDLEPNEVIKLRNSGTGTAFLRSLRDAGYDLSPDEAVKLRNSGVSAEYAGALKKAGYDLSVDEIMRLRNSGVSADYAAALVVEGRRNLSVDDVIRLLNAGMNAELARRLRE